MNQTVQPVTIIIPARYASTRYPGKPLAMIRGASGLAKPLIQRSHEAACSVPGVTRVLIATDDARIADAARDFGADVVMTPEQCRNGTERVAAVLERTGPEGIFINFQGDALLTPADLVGGLIGRMQDDAAAPVATVAVRCSASAYAHLVHDQAQGRVGGTTAVVNTAGQALYFSKRVIPYIAPGDPAEAAPPVLMHLGLYAYRADALRQYAATPPHPVEQLEGLEQLRFLMAGIPVSVVVSDPPEWDAIELNNPSDLAPIEAILAARGLD